MGSTTVRSTTVTIQKYCRLINPQHGWGHNENDTVTVSEQWQHVSILSFLRKKERWQWTLKTCFRMAFGSGQILYFSPTIPPYLDLIRCPLGRILRVWYSVQLVPIILVSFFWLFLSFWKFSVLGRSHGRATGSSIRSRQIYFCGTLQMCLVTVKYRSSFSSSIN